ncbi:tetratricopeptide repeat protein [Acinetobacter sp. ANC 4640]
MNLEEAKQKLHQALDLYKKNEIDQAKEIFEQLSSEIDPNLDQRNREVYVKSQFFLGYCYEQQRELEKAIVAYENVPKEAQKLYAEAQTHIGGIYYQLKKLDEAIVAYQQVPSEDYGSYAKAQFNAGIIYYQQNKLNQAIEVLKNLPATESKIYAKAQFNLGFIYKEQGDEVEAIAACKRVSKAEQEYYAKAQIILGVIYKNKGEIETAIAAYQSVSEEQHDWYAKAQFNLGLIYKEDGNLQAAVETYGNIPQTELRIYTQGRWNILMIYLDQKEFLKFENELKCIDSEKEKYLSQVSYYLNLYRKIASKNLIEKLSPLVEKIEELSDKLVVDQPEDQFIAHYTEPKVAYLMLDHKNQEQVSKFRLNPIDFMNDPTEGALINRLFSLKAQEKPNAQIEQHKSFIGCFTLHHDSLNQFRLYGKENQREASGVSLVLKRSNLFESESNFSFINHNSPNLQKESVDLEDTEKVEKLAEDITSQSLPFELKLPLYRCIYFDPDSGLAHVAQREEWTFCREKGSCQDNGWDGYKNEIDSVNKSVRELITDIQKLIQEINSAENSDEAELIDEILLPLRYLIKHYAFKEEQECRTIYITQWNDSRIKLDPNLKRVYVDYQSVLPAMEKIFLSVGALHHESALQYLGQTADQTFIVKRSHNPFRT